MCNETSLSCENYFDGFHFLADFKTNSCSKNCLGILKLVSYFTVAIPLLIGIVYAVSSLMGRVALYLNDAVDPRIRTAIETVRANTEFLAILDKDLKNNIEVVKAAVRQNGCALRYASLAMQNNQAVVLVAVRQNGWALRYASPAMQNNQAVVLAAVIQFGKALRFASSAMQNNEAVVLAAVRQNGRALLFASSAMQNNEAVVLAAVRQNGLALEYAPPAMQNNEAVILAAVRQYGYALEYAPPAMQNNKIVVLAAVRQNGLAFQYASPLMQSAFEVMEATGIYLARNPDSINHFAYNQERSLDWVNLMRGDAFTRDPEHPCTRRFQWMSAVVRAQRTTRQVGRLELALEVDERESGVSHILSRI